jgi:hypothetical protein
MDALANIYTCRNLIFTKKQFWFGSEPVDYKKLSAAVKHDAHHIQSWASETGKGLLYYGETHNTANPQGVILLVSHSSVRYRVSSAHYFA